jgi:hypothetical protein
MNLNWCEMLVTVGGTGVVTLGPSGMQATVQEWRGSSGLAVLRYNATDGSASKFRESGICTINLANSQITRNYIKSSRTSGGVITNVNATAGNMPVGCKVSFQRLADNDQHNALYNSIASVDQNLGMASRALTGGAASAIGASTIYWGFYPWDGGPIKSIGIYCTTAAASTAAHWAIHDQELSLGGPGNVIVNSNNNSPYAWFDMQTTGPKVTTLNIWRPPEGLWLGVTFSYSGLQVLCAQGATHGPWGTVGGLPFSCFLQGGVTWGNAVMPAAGPNPTTGMTGFTASMPLLYLRPG